VTGGTATAGGTASGSGGRPRGDRRADGPDGREASPAAKLCGFLILMVLVFIAAYAAGARVGPVTAGHPHPAHGGQMNMGAPAGPAGARR
jgi:hypothetical protein